MNHSPETSKVHEAVSGLFWRVPRELRASLSCFVQLIKVLLAYEQRKKPCLFLWNIDQTRDLNLEKYNMKLRVKPALIAHTG